jgi:hypothetical protein
MTQPSHPAPQRHRLSRLRMAITLIGAPAAWVALMSVNFIAASYSCYPHRIPLDHPLWPQATVWLNLFSLLCLALGLISGHLAWRNWRATRYETGGEKNHAVTIGEGRTRFLALLGLMSSSLFIAAILFTLCAIWLVSPCKPWI